jgi:hypothetical protein
MTLKDTNQADDQQTTTEPEYIPHDTGMDSFDDATMESEPERSTTTAAEEATDDGATDDDNQEENEVDNAVDDTPDGGSADDDASVFMFDDQEIEPGEPHTETEREKALREENEQLRKQQREQQTDESEQLKEPDLYDPEIGGDEAKYKAALRDYYKEQGKREAMAESHQKEQELRQQAERVRFKENVALYGQRMASVKNTLPDIGQADDMLGRELPQMHQAALFSAGVDNPEMVAYALYKNKTLREQYTKEQNPVRLGMMIANISKRAQLAPKGKAKPLNKEPKPKGSQGAHPNKHGLSGEFADATIE